MIATNTEPKTHLRQVKNTEYIKYYLLQIGSEIAEYEGKLKKRGGSQANRNKGFRVGSFLELFFDRSVTLCRQVSP